MSTNKVFVAKEQMMVVVQIENGMSMQTISKVKVGDKLEKRQQNICGEINYNYNGAKGKPMNRTISAITPL